MNFLPWMVLGDFNEVLLPSEQRGGSFVHSRALAFSNVLNGCDLADIHSVGGQFTWFRNWQGRRILSKKLDRGVGDAVSRSLYGGSD